MKKEPKPRKKNALLTEKDINFILDCITEINEQYMGSEGDGEISLFGRKTRRQEMKETVARLVRQRYNLTGKWEE